MKKIVIIILALFFMITGLYAQPIVLISPNNKLKVEIDIANQVKYSLFLNDNILMKDNSMSIELDKITLGNSLKLVNKKFDTVEELITPCIPLRFSSVNSKYNRVLLTFKDNYAIEFRAYNEGVAYRFITKLKGNIEVKDESTILNFVGDYKTVGQFTNTFKTSCEEYYNNTSINDWSTSDKMAFLPILFQSPSGVNILFSESGLINYPGMFLVGNNENSIKSIFPPYPLSFGEDGDRSLKIEQTATYIANTNGTRDFPWRYFVITDDDRDLLTTTMTLQLAPKSVITDQSWIHPGQVSWEWWNDASPYGDDVNFKAGYNLDTYKYYIDFASKYGISYIIMDEGWAKSTLDPYTPNPNVDVHEIIKYGKEKNVGVILWLTWLCVDNNMELFKTFSEWGVKGVKIDFMDRSDQWMVDFYERTAKEAAKYNLLVDFHGSFKPAGLEYKYPNIISYEGVRGMEQMGGCKPDNSIYLPFIRNAVGAMDYTPGAMISMQPEVYVSARPNSASIGTRAYQLALFVVFESGLQMLADNPTLYYRNPDCIDFITSVPTTWDQTTPLHAEVGQIVATAKRKGDKWYIGAITNNKENERNLVLDFDFLSPNKTYKMTYFEDGINAGRQAMDYRKKEISIKKGDKLPIKLVRNGGWAAIIE